MQMDEGGLMQPVDEYALMEWLKGEAMKESNEMYAAQNVRNTYDDMYHRGKLHALNAVITHIQNGRVNSRPHVKERI